MWLFSVAFASPDADFDAAIARMLAASATLRDATFDLHQEETIGGRTYAALMHVRYRAPNDAYVVWDDGQRVLWVPGRNDDRLWVDPGRFLPTISLDPEGALAMRGQRHSVRRLGFTPVATLFAADRERILARPELRPAVVDLGSRDVYGRDARCFDAVMRKDLEPRLYAHRVEVCFDTASGLPTSMKCWDEEGGTVRQVEAYVYEHLAVNPGVGPLEPEALGF